MHRSRVVWPWNAITSVGSEQELGTLVIDVVFVNGMSLSQMPTMLIPQTTQIRWRQVVVTCIIFGRRCISSGGYTANVT